ncbi:MAG: hypothetical protein AB7S57_18740 [Acetobacteraceae bacterium]
MHTVDAGSARNRQHIPISAAGRRKPQIGLEIGETLLHALPERRTRVGFHAFQSVPKLAQQLLLLGPRPLDRLIVRTLTFKGTHCLSLSQPEATRLD